MKKKIKSQTAEEKAAHAIIGDLLIDEYWMNGQIEIMENVLRLWRHRRQAIRAQIKSCTEALKK